MQQLPYWWVNFGVQGMLAARASCRQAGLSLSIELFPEGSLLFQVLRTFD